ncbi:MAG: hypothetical protein ACYDHU_09510 [Acidimicrobiales bacterium]
MTLDNQSIPELFILLTTGLALGAAGGVLVTNYRGILARYAHNPWKHYQRPCYQKLFLWTKEQRAHDADRSFIRNAIRIPEAGMALMGLGVVVLEVAARTSEHVL